MDNLSILNLVLSAINACFAYDSFKKGQIGMAWINVGVSIFCFAVAMI